MARNPATAFAPSCCSFSGRRLGTVTVEAEAFASCSDALRVERAADGSCRLPRTPHSTEPCNGSDACTQYWEPPLPRLMVRSKVYWNNDRARRAGAARCGYELPSYRDDDGLCTVPQGTFPERLRHLSAVLHSDFKRLRTNRALCDLALADLVDACKSRPALLDAPPMITMEGPDLSARIGILVFFRLLGSLRRNNNTAGIVKLITRVPSMIANTPVLSLSPHLAVQRRPQKQSPRDSASAVALAGSTAGVNTGGVVEAIMSAAEGLLHNEHELSGKQHGDVLEALVGLAVKRGSLIHFLRVVKILLCSEVADGALPIPGVGHYLKVSFS